MDSIMKEGNRLEFACIYVEMEVDHAFPGSIELCDNEMVDLKVEYSWRLRKCKFFKSFGHKIDDCKRRLEGNDNVKSRRGYFKKMSETYEQRGKL